MCSEECEHIKLRRGEKTLLNGINKRLGLESLQRCIVDPARQGRVLERISTGPQKIFLLVRCRLSRLALHPKQPPCSCYTISIDAQQLSRLPRWTSWLFVI